MAESIFEDTNPKPLKELLAQINGKEAALPDFQRDFVWDPNATQELLVSIASNYPAGSLLRIRNTHDLFACREFQGAPSIEKQRPTYLVLDGQQRLTSLYQAFFGVGDHRYFLDLKALIDGKDFEDCISHLRHNSKAAKELEQVERQREQLKLPLSVVKGAERSGYQDWCDDALDLIDDKAKRDSLRNQLKDKVRPWIDCIEAYHFPVVTLSDSTSAEAVCTIFETLNRTGVKLTPFELLTARFWPRGVNLRQLWASARETEPSIQEFGIDPYYLLQAVALVSRTAPSCKRGDVLQLEADIVNKFWEPVVAGFAKAIEILRDDCGVMTPQWLPYSTLLVPLAAVLTKHPLPGTAAAGAARQKLGQWFWCSTFGQTYEGSSNSQAAQDFSEVLGWLDGGSPPESVKGFKFDPRILIDTTVRQRALYSGVICLLLRNHPRDFYNGARLTGDLIVEHQVDDHHIFPDAFLGESVEPRLKNCVINRTLIDRKTNIRIGKRAPSKYMADIRKELGPAVFQQLLKSHLLPSDDDSALWNDNFANLLAWRTEAVWQEIKNVTGISESSDLLEDAA